MASAYAKKTGLLTIVIMALSVAVIFFATTPPPARELHSFSFEADMQGWATNGTDLEHEGSTLMWSVVRSGDRATNGSESLRFYLNNLNDKGKIWIEKGFPAVAGRTYLVTVKYDFASQDYGDANLWTIITGALGKRPQTVEDLTHCFQGLTGNGLETNGGFVWMAKSYNLTAMAGPDGLLWVVIGVWGTWETARGYFVDNVRVTLTGG